MKVTEEMYADLKSQLPELQEALREGLAWGTDLATRYIQYDIAVHIGWLLVWLGFSSFALYWNIRFFKWGKKNDAEAVTTSLFTFGLIAFIFLAFFATNTGIILKGIFVPEVRIVELISKIF